MKTANKLASIAQANQKPVVSQTNKTEKQLKWASHQHMRNLSKKFLELASQGYGSVCIKLDYTYDNFMVQEKPTSYIGSFVQQLLSNEGYKLTLIDDCMDALIIKVEWSTHPEHKTTIGMYL
jgi:hypothetical protein